MGDVVLGELLIARGLEPEELPAIQDFVVCVTPEQRPLGLQVAHWLRDAGRRVVYDFEDRSVGRQRTESAGVAERSADTVTVPE